MPEVRDFQSVVEFAEQAAGAGDFVRAEALLREAAALQEASLGPLHPDLARTFNNLAVACERADKPTDAERFYRRAFDIATAALAPDDPLVATSRDNLRDFCQSRGLVFEDWPGISDHVATPAAAPPPAPAPVVPPPATAPTLRGAVAAATAGAPAAPAPTRRPAPPRAAAGGSVRAFGGALAVVAVVATLALVYLLMRPGTNRAADTPPVATPAATPAPAPAPATAPASTAATSVPAAPDAAAPTATAPNAVAPAAVAPASAAASAAASAQAAPVSTPAASTASSPPAAAPADLRVVTATVCASLDTGAGAWRCAAVETEGAPGRFAYFTRIASPRAVRVRHRWYQGDRLRQDVVLAVGANAGAGYRTFSRQTVAPGDWRVELRADGGALLGESRFVVRAR